MTEYLYHISHSAQYCFILINRKPKQKTYTMQLKDRKSELKLIHIAFKFYTHCSFFVAGHEQRILLKPNLIFVLIHSFLDALDLCCCPQAFSSCGKRGLLFLQHVGLSLRWLLLQSAGSRFMVFSSCGPWAQELWHMSLADPQHVESSQTRDQTRDS